MSDGNILCENGVPVSNCNVGESNTELLPIQQLVDMRETTDSAPEISVCESNPCSRFVNPCTELSTRKLELLHEFYYELTLVSHEYSNDLNELFFNNQLELCQDGWPTLHVRRAAELFEKIRFPWIAFFKFSRPWFVIIIWKLLWRGSFREVKYTATNLHIAHPVTFLTLWPPRPGCLVVMLFCANDVIVLPVGNIVFIIDLAKGFVNRNLQVVTDQFTYGFYQCWIIYFI